MEILAALQNISIIIALFTYIYALIDEEIKKN